MLIANISEVWIKRTYTLSVIHVSVSGCTVKQTMYRCYHRLISWRATFCYSHMCWLDFLLNFHLVYAMTCCVVSAIETRRTSHSVSYTPTRTLRSINTGLLVLPTGVISHFASRSFFVSFPSVWNSLPAHVRSIDNLSTFKRHLKAHLFQSAFAA